MITIEDVTKRDYLFEELDQIQERISALNKYMENNRVDLYEYDDDGSMYRAVEEQLKAMNEYEDQLSFRIEMMKKN